MVPEVQAQWKLDGKLIWPTWATVAPQRITQWGPSGVMQIKWKHWKFDLGLWSSGTGTRSVCSLFKLKSQLMGPLLQVSFVPSQRWEDNYSADREQLMMEPKIFSVKILYYIILADAANVRVLVTIQVLYSAGVEEWTQRLISGLEASACWCNFARKGSAQKVSP